MLIPCVSELCSKHKPFSLVQEVAASSFHLGTVDSLTYHKSTCRILLKKVFKPLHGIKISLRLVNCVIKNESNMVVDLQKSGHVMWFSNKCQLLNRFIERKKNNLNSYIYITCYYFRLNI